ncbi:uncharacterized protein LOC108704988 [Xenopus laevis]|uniref:Uncharacterized protein LOC108704988 n=1 Tax=Xenopus laevis TaxID=8355 RepID=A0A8J0U5X4_XENLA|nr:uncharacterized protein LOC108704988 [Xenopus laevis]
MSPSFLAPLILTVLGVQITCSNGNPETGQCNVSEINGINRTVGDKDHYETGGSVSVWCSPGYDPRNKTITCRSNGMSVMWDDPVPCTERCKESDLSRDIRVHLVPLQDYYPPNTEVSVRCPLGYKPSHKTITCKAQHGHNVWDEAVIRCVEQCAKPTGLGIISLSEEKDFYDLWESVIVTCARGYHAVSGAITCEWQGTRSDWNEPDLCIVLIKPHFTQFPSTSDTLLKWRLSEGRKVYVGLQLNISAHREYDLSFYKTESHWLRPNVREFNMELKHGTNYTVTLQGFTSAGPGEPAVWTHETPIAEPPPPLKKKIEIGDSTATFKLHPVPDLNGPISSYEIIVTRGWNGSLSHLCTSYTSTESNSSHIPSVYTAMLVPAMNLKKSRTFTLGDGLYYNGFFNSPMNPELNYKVYLRVTSRWKEVKKASCTCFDPYVALKLEITHFPNLTENLLQWRRVGGSRRNITGYQLNTLVWKENTVIEEESHQFPPNVTEYRIPMEADTNYMVTVRGLTAAGPGEASVWISGNRKAAGASDSYFRVSLVLKPLFLIILILVLLCFTVKEKWEQNRTDFSAFRNIISCLFQEEKRHQGRTERGGSERTVPL